MKRVVGKEMIMDGMIVEVMTLEAREVEVMIRKVTEAREAIVIAMIEATVKFIPPLIASRREMNVGQ